VRADEDLPGRNYSIHPEIAERKNQTAGIFRHYDVARLEVCGSAARGTDFYPSNSDAELLVEFFPDSELQPFDLHFDLLEALKEALGRPVDLLQPGANYADSRRHSRKLQEFCRHQGV